jgi:ribose/xylose/arabinose/galactoside ABC-type transport system permease subunit
VSSGVPGQLLPQTIVAAAPRRQTNLLWLLLALLLVIVLGGVIEYFRQGTLNYWAPSNQFMISTQIVTVAIGAIGMTLIIILGGIDLSAGSVIAMTAMGGAAIVRYYSPPDAGTLTFGEYGPLALWVPLLAVVAAVGLGTAAGAANGGLITGLRMAPFIITLGMMTFARGTAKWIGHETTIHPPTSWISDFTKPTLTLFTENLVWGPFEWNRDVSVSSAVLVTLFLAAVAGVMLNRTRFGRHIFAIGSNESTARLCGVRVEYTKCIVYALAGATFGLAGVTDLGRLGAGDPTTAVGKELDIIAAVVIGGGSLTGGSGSVLGALLGAILMAHLRNLCIHLGLPTFVQEMVVGPVIIAAVAIYQLRHRKRE